MRSLTALLAALLLPATPTLIVGAAVSSTLLITQAPVKAQSAEAVAQAAKTITVRIEGATQGSGVLVKRDGNTYTVLTAWHVVSGQKPGEELDIYTPDGERYSVEQGSIKRLGQLDMAVLSFTSSASYEVARVGDVKSAASGQQVVVAGFPNNSKGRLEGYLGRLIANAAIGIEQGYQLLYTSHTISGISGGVVLNKDGKLIGIHGRGGLDQVGSQHSGNLYKTGINRGIPIYYYDLYVKGLPIAAFSNQAETADDYMALLENSESEQDVIKLADHILEGQQSELIREAAYAHRAYAKFNSGDYQGAIADFNQIITINPQHYAAYGNRGGSKAALGDHQGAITDYNQAISMNPEIAHFYINRGGSKAALGDHQGAFVDYSKAISIDPKFSPAYVERGNTKGRLGDHQGARDDFSQAVAINPQNDRAYYGLGIAKRELNDLENAIKNLNRAIAINPKYDLAYIALGDTMDDIGDSNSALDNYSIAISIKETSLAYRNRAAIWQKLGKKQEMCSDIEKAIRLGGSGLQEIYTELCR